MSKKPIQNVLAQNSTGEIAYLCGKCSRIVDKEDMVCKHCGARLGNIKCPFCNFTGTPDDFQSDTCPRCGRKKSSGTDSKKKNRVNPKKSNSSSFDLLNYFWLLFILLITFAVGIVVYIFKHFGLI